MHMGQVTELWLSYYLVLLSIDMITRQPQFRDLTNICTLVNYAIIGSGNGLSPVWHQAIIWTNVDLLPIRPLATNFSEISIEIQWFAFEKMNLKISSVDILSRAQ